MLINFKRGNYINRSNAHKNIESVTLSESYWFISENVNWEKISFVKKFQRFFRECEKANYKP
jgi:hypothetical protein